MDRNKALYKLKGLPPIYYLNLDAEPERKIFMETQLEYWGIEIILAFLLMMVGVIGI